MSSLCRCESPQMHLSLYEASVPVFLRYLSRLTGFVEVAERFARENELSISELLSAKMAPDMLPFERQVVTATNFTLRATFPLAGEAIPPYGDFPETAAGLRDRAEHAASLLRSLQSPQFAGAETRMLESQAGEALVRLPATEFLFQYALPNFFFHVTAAYAILRSRGVPLGKEDFDGYHSYPREP